MSRMAVDCSTLVTPFNQVAVECRSHLFSVRSHQHATLCKSITLGVMSHRHRQKLRTRNLGCVYATLAEVHSSDEVFETPVTP